MHKNIHGRVEIENCEEMDVTDITAISPTIKLEYTYNLSRGRFPEKIILQKDRYSIINFNEHKHMKFYTKKGETYVCGIYDHVNNSYLNMNIRKNHNNKIINKCVRLYTDTDKQIIQTYYIPLCTRLLGDPDKIKSISIDHIDIDNSNDCIDNLRWATPSEQNNNKTFKNSSDEYDDWIYIFENTEYKSIEKLYNYLLETKRIKDSIPGKRFRDQLQKSCKKNKNTYGLNITRRILQLNNNGNELWKELDQNLELKQFKYISNYGRLGRIENNIMVARTATIDKSGYQNIKLKYLKSFISIHRLVYMHFIGDIPDGYIIDHIDENKSNNHVSNLQLLTTKENIKKTYDTNKNHKATANIKLTNKDINKILEFNNLRLCADHFNISYDTLRYKIKVAFNKQICINNIIYDCEITYKKDYSYKDTRSPKIYMVNINNNILKSFYSEREIYTYYKQNGYEFSPPHLKAVLNTKQIYNIPDVYWITNV
jgi:hypothetical protein